MEHYRAWKCQGYAAVIDSERRSDESVVARCSRPEDAEKIARLLNADEGAVVERDRLRRAFDYLYAGITDRDEFEHLGDVAAYCREALALGGRYADSRTPPRKDA